MNHFVNRSYYELIEDIRERFKNATIERDNAENPLSEAFYEGYRDALGELLEQIADD